MRNLTSDEKIIIKTILQRYGVLDCVFDNFDMKTAISLFYRCTGKSISTYKDFIKNEEVTK